MKTMRRAHVAPFVAVGVVLTAATAVVACSPFSGSDAAVSTDSGAAANHQDGATGADGGSGSSGFDYDTCANRIHVTEGFEDGGFPPAPWKAESYGGGTARLETTVVNTGRGSLKADLVANTPGSGGMIGYVLPIKALPRGIRVRYAYKPVAADFKGTFYAEVGCNVAFATSDNNNAFIDYASGTTEIGLGGLNAGPLANGFDTDVWRRVSHELLIDTAAPPGDAGVALYTTLSDPSGGNSTAGLNASLHGTLLPIEIFCGIPYALSDLGSTLTAYVDDVEIDVCP